MTPCSCYHNYDMLIKKLEYFIMKQYKKCEKSPYFFYIHIQIKSSTKAEDPDPLNHT